jgi:ABC-type iron transport system FetAB ATPase subunit
MCDWPVSKSSILLQVKALRRPMLTSCSFEVAAKECVCISGPSGAGKSVLLRAIADLDPYEGEVLLDGVAVTEYAPDEWRRQTGLLPSESSWWFQTPLEHFHNGIPVPLDRVGLRSPVLEKPINYLSSGEKQRLALLRLLANRPRVLLLDEPTANLDDENTQRVEEIIKSYRREHEAAVLWISHNRDQIERVANRHFILDENGLLEQKMEWSEWLR